MAAHHAFMQQKTVNTEKGSVVYLNSGDWIENLTALEYVDGEWKIYRYDEKEMQQWFEHGSEEEELNNTQLFDNMLEEFNLMKQ